MNCLAIVSLLHDVNVIGGGYRHPSSIIFLMLQIIVQLKRNILIDSNK